MSPGGYWLREQLAHQRVPLLLVIEKGGNLKLKRLSIYSFLLKILNSSMSCSQKKKNLCNRRGWYKLQGVESAGLARLPVAHNLFWHYAHPAMDISVKPSLLSIAFWHPHHMVSNGKYALMFYLVTFAPKCSLAPTQLLAWVPWRCAEHSDLWSCSQRKKFLTAERSMGWGMEFTKQLVFSVGLATSLKPPKRVSCLACTSQLNAGCITTGSHHWCPLQLCLIDWSF